MSASFALLTLIYFALGLATDVAYGLSTPRIINGKDAPDGKFPYQVGIYHKIFSKYWCGGSIVNKRYILTSAGCVYQIPEKSLEVWYGTNHLNRPGVIRANIEKIIPHELYYAYSSNYDIALLKLESEIVEYSKKVQPVILPTSDFTNKTVKAVVSGWDRPGYNEPHQWNMQYIDMVILPHEQCFAATNGLSVKHICAVTEFGEGTCKRDFGGPLVVDGVQVGIAASPPLPCSHKRPDVFTRVYHYLEWIGENTSFDLVPIKMIKLYI